MPHCVLFRNLENEEAMARVGPQCHIKKYSYVYSCEKIYL
jgi:hypothetical protein